MDSNGNFPINLTTDKNIKKLINKFISPRKSGDKKKLSEDDIEIAKFHIGKQIPFRPPRPTKAIGFLEKAGNLMFNYNSRFLEVDSIVGSLRRFKCEEDYPNKSK